MEYISLGSDTLRVLIKKTPTTLFGTGKLNKSQIPT